MLHAIFIILFYTVAFPKIAIASPQVTCPSETLPVHNNANHIFNAIHSSMRQWGSSLNHNGMSFFPGYLPAGTELYHGRGSPDQVKWMEWLAFEPEHALNFAWNLTWQSPAKGSGNQYDLSPKWLLDDLMNIYKQQPLENELDNVNKQSQRNSQQSLLYGGKYPLLGKRPRSKQPYILQAGWLHTYVMKRDLRVVYVDGQSAAKTDKGTLDSQDFVLCAGEHTDDPIFDGQRAMHMCQIASEVWNGRIDGFIRMEHGFELILCDFETSADLVRVERADGSYIRDRESSILENFLFLKAITARYHGIGMSRVFLDYSRMVSAFAYDINLFFNQTELPRLRNVSTEDNAKIFEDLTKGVMSDDQKHPTQWTDWQAVADMIVARYSDVLHELAYGSTYNSRQRIKQGIDLLTRPFIDYDHRNTILEIQRCTSHFIPSNYSFSTASAAVSTVSNEICSTLFDAADMQFLDAARRRLQALVEYLQWTSWKECRGCGYDTLCFTAIWPFGNEEDHIHPSCRNGTDIVGRWGYWRQG